MAAGGEVFSPLGAIACDVSGEGAVVGTTARGAEPDASVRKAERLAWISATAGGGGVVW